MPTARMSSVETQQPKRQSSTSEQEIDAGMDGEVKAEVDGAVMPLPTGMQALLYGTAENRTLFTEGEHACPGDKTILFIDDLNRCLTILNTVPHEEYIRLLRVLRSKPGRVPGTSSEKTLLFAAEATELFDRKLSDVHNAERTDLLAALHSWEQFLKKNVDQLDIKKILHNRTKKREKESRKSRKGYFKSLFTARDKTIAQRVSEEFIAKNSRHAPFENGAALLHEYLALENHKEFELHYEHLSEDEKEFHDLYVAPWLTDLISTAFLRRTSKLGLQWALQPLDAHQHADEHPQTLTHRPKKVVFVVDPYMTEHLNEKPWKSLKRTPASAEDLTKAPFYAARITESELREVRRLQLAGGANLAGRYIEVEVIPSSNPGGNA